MSWSGRAIPHGITTTPTSTSSVNQILSRSGQHKSAVAASSSAASASMLPYVAPQPTSPVLSPSLEDAIIKTTDGVVAKSPLPPGQSKPRPTIEQRSRTVTSVPHVDYENGGARIVAIDEATESEKESEQPPSNRRVNSN